jgi:hypothetical protein
MFDRVFTNSEKSLMKKYFSTILTVTFALSATVESFLALKAIAQSDTRPYVMLVNGYNDCCVWSTKNRGIYMDTIRSELEKHGAEVKLFPWDTFREGKGEVGWDSNDSYFLREASHFINNTLDPNRPLILIGHSFGGDSLLSLVPRINRRIQFLGVIDPVAAGGLRLPVTGRGVPSTVDYFFNRWQRNGLNGRNVVPFDSRAANGSISNCQAQTCDQEEQNLSRNSDGSEIRVNCGKLEISCSGYQAWPGGSNGTKAERIAHNDMPLDRYLQRQMANQINKALSFSQLGFYRQQNRPEVYLKYRSAFYCHVQNEEQMGTFGGFDKVKVSSSVNLVGKNTGDCGWPNGFFRRSNQPEVYRMYGGGIPEFNIGDSFCHVANEAQMNAFGGFEQVRVVPPSSDLGRGRNFTGDCSNS